MLHKIHEYLTLYPNNITPTCACTHELKFTCSGAYIQKLCLQYTVLCDIQFYSVRAIIEPGNSSSLNVCWPPMLTPTMLYVVQCIMPETKTVLLLLNECCSWSQTILFWFKFNLFGSLLNLSLLKKVDKGQGSSVYRTWALCSKKHYIVFCVLTFRLWKCSYEIGIYWSVFHFVHSKRAIFFFEFLIFLNIELKKNHYLDNPLRLFHTFLIAINC